MNEFEWRRQMRDLRQPLAPSRDLWTSIEAALDAATPAADPVATTVHRTARPRRWMIAASLAASVVLAVIAGFNARVQTTSTMTASTTAAWKPADPRLAGAATELNAAHSELQQAIEQAPHSPALQRLLLRTEQQQTQLRQLAREAG